MILADCKHPQVVKSGTEVAEQQTYKAILARFAGSISSGTVLEENCQLASMILAGGLNPVPALHVCVRSIVRKARRLMGGGRRLNSGDSTDIATLTESGFLLGNTAAQNRFLFELVGLNPRRVPIIDLESEKVGFTLCAHKNKDGLSKIICLYLSHIFQLLDPTQWSQRSFMLAFDETVFAKMPDILFMGGSRAVVIGPPYNNNPQDDKSIVELQYDVTTNIDELRQQYAHVGGHCNLASLDLCFAIKPVHTDSIIFPITDIPRMPKSGTKAFT